MQIHEYPHLVLLAANPDLKDKLGKDIIALIDFFQKQFNVYDSYKVIGGGNFKIRTQAVKDEAKQNLLESSNMIADYITDFIKNAPDPAAAQASAAAKEEVKEIKEEIIVTQEEVKDLFEDLEELISEEVTVERSEQRLLFKFTDTVKEVQSRPNPNFGKKYAMVDGQRVYEGVTK